MARRKTLPETIDKICPICEKNFTISYYLRNKRTYCSKSCSNHDPKVIEKMIISQTNTFNEKYGMHPMKTEQTKENLKASVKGKYGVEWISSKDGWYNKIKENNFKKYGMEHYNNHEQAKATCLKKYGVEYPTKDQNIREKMNENRKTLHYIYLQEYCQKNNLKVLFNREDYNGYDFKNKYKFQCEKCNYIFDSDVYKLNSLFCEKCEPNKKQTLENSFFDFLTSLNPPLLITRRDRTILYGKELDFYLPDKKIAFELNGLYWHSENGHGIKKHYHLNKTKGCIAHGVRLIHIFENEWRDKPELIKSVITTILKLQVNNCIYARKCEIREVSIKEKDLFLNENHLQQRDKSTIKLGLYYNNELVSLMTFRRTSRFDSKVEWELSRFCNLKNTIIMGGASKLFIHFLKTYSPKSIVSYNDRRYFSGDLYHTLGFSFIDNTPPSYHYITPDYKNTINRMNFQKHLLQKKLTIFDPTLSEWENMKTNGYDRIWDCGCGKWIWKIHQSGSISLGNMLYSPKPPNLTL